MKIIGLHNVADANDAIGESMRLACIDHPNVVQVHEQFIDSSMSLRLKLSRDPDIWEMLNKFFAPYRICIALELCSGDLEIEISKWKEDSAKRPAWPQLLRIFQEIVEGIEALHLKNIVHCDLKPANVFISADHKHVKIGDLGLAKTVQKRRVTQRKLGYIAPEIWDDDANSTGYSTCADNWSLGCIMVDLAYPTAVGGWAISSLLAEVGHPMEEEYDDDLALMLMDPRRTDPPRDQVLGSIIEHASLSECITAQTIVERSLVLDPRERWGCEETLQQLGQIPRARSMCIKRPMSCGTESQSSLA